MFYFQTLPKTNFYNPSSIVMELQVVLLTLILLKVAELPEADAQPHSNNKNILLPGFEIVRL